MLKVPLSSNAHKRKKNLGFFSISRRAGESLVEVIMAIFVVAIGAGIAATLVVTSFESNNFSRDNLIAVNLAVEGIEAMRSIRDTNWLQYSFDRADCWNLLPNVTCISPYQTIASGHYTVYEDVNNRWQMNPVLQTDLDLIHQSSAQTDPYALKIVNSFGASQPGLRFFVPKDVVCSLPCLSLSTDPENLRFYRMIKIVNLPDDSNVKTIDVQSLVEWRSQGIVHKVSLVTQLTNYQP